MADIESKLIKSTGPRGKSEESSESRSRAAHHQETPVYELNSSRLTRTFDGSRPKGYSVKEYIESVKRTKARQSKSQNE
ncbi:MAG: hypothetical protein ACC618_01000 [Patescibacteria group bacterium]